MKPAKMKLLIKSLYFIGLIWFLTGGCGGGPEVIKPETEKKPVAGEKIAARLDDGSAGSLLETERAVDKTAAQALKEMEETRKVKDGQQSVVAERYYQSGLKFYLENEYEKAKKQFEQAKELGHPKAAEKLDEIRALQGEFVRGDLGRISRDYIDSVRVKIQGAQIEVENHLYKGIRAYESQQYKEAEEEFKWVIEAVEWFPYQTELTIYQQQAKDYLKKTQEQKEAQETILRRRQEEEARRRAQEEEMKRQDDFTKTVEILFRQAQEQFEKENYDESISLCERILENDPANPVATRLQQIATAARRAQFRKLTTKTLAEEWKKTFESFALKTIPQHQVVKFPDKKTWEKIDRRGPRTIIKEKPASPLNQEAERFLDRRMNFSFSNDGAPLADIIQYIRDMIPGVNITPSSDVSLEEQFSPNFIDTPLRIALTQLLKPKDWGIMVQDGVIIITTNEKIKESMVETRWYDILDLTIPIIDLPGPNLGLEQIDEPTEEVAIPRISGDQLKDLIQSNIAKAEGGWEAPFSIEFQESNGVLVIKHLPMVQQQITKLLAEIRTAMDMVVTIESRFLEVSENFMEDIGVDMRGLQAPAPVMPAYFGTAAPNGPAFTDDSAVAGTQLSSGIYGLYENGFRDVRGRVENILGGDQLVSNFYDNVLANTGGATLSYTFLDDTDVSMILRAVQKDQRSKILRAPRLTVFNGQRAHIYIAEQFTYIKDYDIIIAVPPNAMVDPIPDVISEGTVLDVRPSISADLKYITMELRPSIAELKPAAPNLRKLNPNLGSVGNPTFEIPDMQYQRLRTNVIIPDGGTILISCYAKGQEIDASAEVPVLSKIPFLGLFFREKMKGRQKQVLMMIIKAKITIMTEEEKKNF